MRLTKIYTKVGDKGSTLLATGERISKSAPRIEAYGTIDELNAIVGCLNDSLRPLGNCADLIASLSTIQNELFDIGAELSLPKWQEQGIKLGVVQETDIERLEKDMDRFNETLEPLANFILPGGHPSNSFSHLARTVCRRGERRIVALTATDAVRPEVLKYVNRLSDWFFVLSRVISQRLKIEEVIWQQKK